MSTFERRLKIPTELRRLKSPMHEASLSEAIPIGGRISDRMPELLANELEKLKSTVKSFSDSALKQQVYVHLLPLLKLLDPYRTYGKSEADAAKARELSHGGLVIGKPTKEALGEAAENKVTPRRSSRRPSAARPTSRA